MLQASSFQDLFNYLKIMWIRLTLSFIAPKIQNLITFQLYIRLQLENVSFWVPSTFTIIWVNVSFSSCFRLALGLHTCFFSKLDHKLMVKAITYLWRLHQFLCHHVKLTGKSITKIVLALNSHPMCSYFSPALPLMRYPTHTYTHVQWPGPGWVWANWESWMISFSQINW